MLNLETLNYSERTITFNKRLAYSKYIKHETTSLCACVSHTQTHTILKKQNSDQLWKSYKPDCSIVARIIFVLGTLASSHIQFNQGRYNGHIKARVSWSGLWLDSEVQS